MKIITALAFSLLIILSCQKKKSDVYPEDLESKKEVLADKKEQLTKLEKEIEVLTDEIAALDPSLKEKARLISTEVLKQTTFEREYDQQ